MKHYKKLVALLFLFNISTTSSSVNEGSLPIMKKICLFGKGFMEGSKTGMPAGIGLILINKCNDYNQKCDSSLNGYENHYWKILFGTWFLSVGLEYTCLDKTVCLMGKIYVLQIMLQTASNYWENKKENNQHRTNELEKSL